MWNIRNNTEDHRDRVGNLNWKISEKEKKHMRLLTLGNKLSSSSSRLPRFGLSLAHQDSSTTRASWRMEYCVALESNSRI